MSEINNSVKKSNQYCGLRLGDGYYGIPVLDVQEVIKPQKITQIPLAENYIKGLINLRGQIVTSIDLRNLFSIQDEKKDDQHMNIIVRGEEHLLSIMVDEILDIVEVESNQVEETPDTIGQNIKKYIDGVFKMSGNLMILINTKKLLTFD